MLGDNTDRSWEDYGKKDPYYGVLTYDKYRTNQLDNRSIKEFFESGEKHIDKLFDRIKNLEKVPRGRALDFGCGVGRLIIPLAKKGFSEVVGVDVSESMLAEARKNVETNGLHNTKLAVSDDLLSKVEGYFDFIHSYIVFQHISVKRGEKIIGQLISRLSPGGLAALHIPFDGRAGYIRRIVNVLRVQIRPLHIIGNVLQQRPWHEKPMQMNSYSIDRVLQIAHRTGIPSATIDLMEKDDNIVGYFYFTKPR